MKQEPRLKTLHSLIPTARVPEEHLEVFDRLRQTHFPADRNFLRAHSTMFHRLPGEHESRIIDQITWATESQQAMTAEVSGVRHLGAGVAFSITSPALEAVRTMLKSELVVWLGLQDMQRWQPHITV